MGMKGLGQSQPIPTHPMPFITIPKASYTHLRISTPNKSPAHPSQAPHAHLKPFIPISGPSHSYQALHTHTKAFTPISGPLYPSLAPHTISWPCTPTLDAPHQSPALLTHLNPIYPSQMFHTHPRPFRSIPVPPHPPIAVHAHT